MNRIQRITHFAVILTLLLLAAPASFGARKSLRVHAIHGAYLLQPAQAHHYFTEFMQQETEATGRHPADPWPWMIANIPWFESSNSQFEQMYYFRWYAFQKHVVKTPTGYVITEFLPHVPWGGYYNTIVDAAPHHLYEARWLRNPQIAEQDAEFWMSPRARAMLYSNWLVNAIYAVSLASGDRQFAIALLPAMEADVQLWIQTHQDPNGLFWSIDTRDAMEKSISGNGYRPTLNSYMYGNEIALAAVAQEAGEPAAAQKYRTAARKLRARIEKYLWDPRAQFYEVRTPRGPDSHFAHVRELLGYIPWYFNIPAKSHAVAWKQLFNPEGFAGKFGPTTAERRSPRFNFVNPDKCKWNGPSWPFATTQTLIAMANLENRQRHLSYATHADYYRLFRAYVRSQHLRLADGKEIPWIDEDLNADTDAWITRDILIERHSRMAGRGNYYNHSGFADPLITGLIGLRPRSDNRIVLHPLLPHGQWNYFALDGLPYHGHLLTIVYDRSGSHYHLGRGYRLFVDGRECASRPTLGPLTCRISPQSKSTSKNGALR